MKALQLDDANSLYKSQDSFSNVMEYFGQLGFQKRTIWEAWKNTNHRQNLMLEELIKLTTEQGQMSQVRGLEKLDSVNKEDSQIQKAISLSLKSFTTETNSEEYIRKENEPVGLVNLGRTCYFNVVIQTLFSIKEVRDILLNMNLDSSQQAPITTATTLTKDGKNSQEEERQRYVNMTKQFQILFSMLLKGQKSNQNPRDLFESLRAFNGEVFKIGEENDFWEFQNSTFELLEKSFSKLYNISESEAKNNNSVNSLFLSGLMPLSIQSDFFTKNLESEKKKEQMSKQQNYNPISDLFYGKIQECITYAEGGSELKKFNEYVQGIVSLEVKHGDLYKALEASQIFEIPDYEVSSGVKTKARVENKFKKAPQILNFNINRLDFDRKKLCTVKLNNQFYFEKELNLDNFCVTEDQFESNLSRDEITLLDKYNRQIKKIEEKLKECQNPNCAPIQLDSCFENVISFLKRQTQQADDFIDIDEYEMELQQADGQFGIIGSASTLKSAIDILTQYQQCISKQTESLTQKLEKLRKERWQIYRKSKKSFYELFSILMHEGTADSGHYYCYIWDEKSKNWYKYNDSTVTVAKEEDLLFEAYGRPDSTKNACCLFYRNKLHKVDYSKNTVVSAQLEEIVKQKDKEFFDEIDKSKVLNALEPFKRQLAQELAKRQATINKNQDSLQCIMELTNFENFLLNLDQFKHFGVRDILIQMLQQCDQKVIRSQLRDQSNLEAGIEIFFQQLQKIYKVPSYSKLSESEESEYSILKESHNTLLGLLKEFESILKDFEKIDVFPTVLKSLCAIQLKMKDINPYITQNSLLGLRLQQATFYMLQVQLLKGCFNIDCNMQKQNTKDLITTTNLMVLALMAFFKNDEKLKKQIESNLKYTLDTHGTNPKIFTSQLFKEFQGSIEKISKVNQLAEKNVYNLREIFVLKYQNDTISQASEVDRTEMATSLLNLWDRSLNVLGLWRSFLDKLTSQKNIISNDERLDQEEIQYTTFMC